jgi:hypothetical protein
MLRKDEVYYATLGNHMNVHSEESNVYFKAAADARQGDFTAQNNAGVSILQKALLHTEGLFDRSLMKQALAFLRKALALDSENEHVHNNIAVVLYAIYGLSFEAPSNNCLTHWQHAWGSYAAVYKQYNYRIVLTLLNQEKDRPATPKHEGPFRVDLPVTIKRSVPERWLPVGGVVRTMGFTYGMTNLLEVFASHVFGREVRTPAQALELLLLLSCRQQHKPQWL